MKATLTQWFPQPVVAIATSMLALVTVGHLWWTALPTISTALTIQTGILALMLGGMVVLTDRHLIHVTYHTKASLSSSVLYLIAVLLPPPVAVVVAGLSKLIAEGSQPAKGNLPSDIATCVSRWILVVFLGTIAAHVPLADAGTPFLLLLGTALVMIAADFVTSGLELGPINGAPPLRVIGTTAQECWQIEGVLYLFGILGAAAAFTSLWALPLLGVPMRIAYTSFKHTKELQESTRRLLESMADTVDLRDPYTGGHSRRVATLCSAILTELRIRGPDAEIIILAARVHDIGKIGLADAILHKPDRLTPAEQTAMETHPVDGAALLARYGDFAQGLGIVRHHHERWDGQGYPDGLAGYAIPFGARVLAVADSLDAMTSDRPYRQGMPLTKALAILQAGQDTQWDSQVVEALVGSFAGSAAHAIPIFPPIP